MRKVPFAGLAAGLGVLALANVLFTGCGSEDSSDDNGGDAGNETSTTDGSGQDAGGNDAFVDAIVDGGRADAPVCSPADTACTSSADCCSFNCDKGTGKCGAPLNNCKLPGTTCATGNECCTLSCVSGSCSNKACVADNGACGVDGDCCGGTCAPDGNGGGICKPLNTTCRTAGNPCTGNDQCCSKLCNNGACSAAVSFCTQQGEICSTNFECCGGVCNKASGATVGTCGSVSAPGVPGCTPAGALCGGGVSDGGVLADGGLPECGGSCCSRSCGPTGTLGYFVCEPPSGCRPTGEICRVDSDCCGWSGSPEPKKGPVTCSKASPTQEFGRCDNGTACREPGSICKPADYSCNAENSCCDPVGFPSNYCQNNPENCCRRDSLGIPRCLVKPVDCTTPVQAGTTCATSADCCGGPCVDNKCGGSCVPSGGSCTTTADCCPGVPCVAPPGSVKGTCGGTLLPDGGVSPDSGTPTDGGADSGSDGGTCSLYGQMCNGPADCCNSVPCTNGTCRFP